MQFVKVRHPRLGETVVPESRVPHLTDGWTVTQDVPDDIDPADPQLTAPPKRASKPRLTTTTRVRSRSRAAHTKES